MIFAVDVFLFSVLYRPVDITLGCQAGVSPQVSEQTRDPAFTFLVMIGNKSPASVSSTKRAKTFPRLVKMPKTGCLVVPRPPLILPLLVLL